MKSPERKLISVEVTSVIDAYIEIETLVAKAIEDGYVKDGNIYTFNGKVFQPMILLSVKRLDDMADELCAKALY